MTTIYLTKEIEKYKHLTFHMTDEVQKKFEKNIGIIIDGIRHLYEPGSFYIDYNEIDDNGKPEIYMIMGVDWVKREKATEATLTILANNQFHYGDLDHYEIILDCVLVNNNTRAELNLYRGDITYFITNDPHKIIENLSDEANRYKVISAEEYSNLDFSAKNSD